jgi:diguanylate cyclase (GGDEF)-like protein
MVAHTPTIFASVALVAIIMAACLAIVGRFRRQDGLFTVVWGVLAHAVAYVCYTLYGHASLWISYGLANSLLSLALAFYAASLFRIRATPAPRLAIFSLPLLMVVCLALLMDTTAQIVYWSLRAAEPGGRAHYLLAIGGVISLIGLLIRVAAILGGVDMDMRYNVSNLKQTISVSIGTVTVMTLSLGLILLAKERSEAAFRRLAMQDGLTGLINRRAILQRLDEERERARRSATPLAVVMLDIDYFKHINDRHGHLAGDMVLNHIAAQLSRRLRRMDAIGRYGGEEFLLLLPDTDAAGALAMTDDLRQAVSDFPLDYQGQSIDISFSAGIYCAVPGPEDSADRLIDKADTLLYQAKEQGRNCTRLLEEQVGPSLVQAHQ